MSAEILCFPHPTAPIQPIAHFIRIGEAHRRLSDLHAAERLPARRVVIDSSRFRFQRELIDAFRKSGAEIVLDTEAAELAALAKFQGQVRKAPWAAVCDGRPLGPQHFAATAATDVIGQTARFAVEQQVDTVLAPTHFLADPKFPTWFNVDRIACLALRASLDREGGSHIAIDYPVIHSHVALNDDAVRQARTVKDLRPSQKEADIREVNLQSLLKRLNAHSGKVDKLYATLGRYHESRANGAPRARPALTRKQSFERHEEEQK